MKSLVTLLKCPELNKASNPYLHSLLDSQSILSHVYLKKSTRNYDFGIGPKPITNVKITLNFWANQCANSVKSKFWIWQKKFCNHKPIDNGFGSRDRNLFPCSIRIFCQNHGEGG